MEELELKKREPNREEIYNKIHNMKFLPVPDEKKNLETASKAILGAVYATEIHGQSGGRKQFFDELFNILYDKYLKDAIKKSLPTWAKYIPFVDYIIRKFITEFMVRGVVWGLQQLGTSKVSWVEKLETFLRTRNFFDTSVLIDEGKIEFKLTV